MRPGQARFVTACQQLLALAAVLAVLTPAASVISLDIVSGDRVHEAGRQLRATGSGTDTAVVATEAVDPVVAEYALTPTASQRGSTTSLKARTKAADAPGATELVSQPLPVSGYGTVGVTWDPGAPIAEDEASFEVRTRTGDEWSTWTDLHYNPEHAPDPDRRADRLALPCTDPLLAHPDTPNPTQAPTIPAKARTPTPNRQSRLTPIRQGSDRTPPERCVNHSP